MNQSIKKQMQHLDSTVLRMDRLMDSITGKQERKIDTMALYLRMAEEARKSHQQEYWIWRIGLIIILIVGVASVWRWKIFKRKNRID